MIPNRCLVKRKTKYVLIATILVIQLTVTCIAVQELSAVDTGERFWVLNNARHTYAAELSRRISIK